MHHQGKVSLKVMVTRVPRPATGPLVCPPHLQCGRTVGIQGSTRWRSLWQAPLGLCLSLRLCKWRGLDQLRVSESVVTHKVT